MNFSVACAERELLSSGASELGVALSQGQFDQCLAFLDLVYVWNRAAGLTTVTRSDAVRLHVLDSLTAVSAIEASPCLDLGSGAGLPGMILAIAKPGSRFILVESNRRRCSFLLEARRRLGLANVEIVESDVETLPALPACPVVVSRAFRSPQEYLRIASGLVAADGQIVVLMADPTDDQLQQLELQSGSRLEKISRLLLPGGHERRAILTFRRA